MPSLRGPELAGPGGKAWLLSSYRSETGQQDPKALSLTQSFVAVMDGHKITCGMNTACAETWTEGCCCW